MSMRDPPSCQKGGESSRVPSASSGVTERPIPKGPPASLGPTCEELLGKESRIKEQVDKLIDANNSLLEGDAESPPGLIQAQIDAELVAAALNEIRPHVMTGNKLSSSNWELNRSFLNVDGNSSATATLAENPGVKNIIAATMAALG